ncbi:MAG: universal stress protein [Methanospirillaceae archaeon]|nr:universal stress protein [Methanospirillaceae archaeon]
MIQRVLVATDGSEASDLAVVWVLENMDTDKTKIFALYVIVPSAVVPFGGRVGVCEGACGDSYGLEQIQKDEELMRRKIETLSEGFSASIQLLVRIGEPRSEILAAAEECFADLIVLGCTGKGLGTRLLLGSVSTYIVTHSPVSTVVVR